MTPPCEICLKNNQPNCGNEWCHTNIEKKRDMNDEIFIVDCGSCGAKSKKPRKQAIEDGCPECGSHNTSIYHEKNA